MSCPACGANVELSAKFCLKCGASLTSGAVPDWKPKGTPNPEHYAALRRVLEQSTLRMTELIKKAGAPVDSQGRLCVSVMAAPIRLAATKEMWETLWKKEFPPAGRPIGRGIPPLFLSGSDFSGMWFCGPVNLDRTDFRGANLERAEMHGVYLNDADLTEARLVSCFAYIFGGGAQFCRADLSKADITFVGCTRTHDFAGANLAEAEIRLLGVSTNPDPPADFTDANLTGAKLEIENARSPILTRACLKNCRIILPETLTELEAALSPAQRAEVTLVKKPSPPPAPVPSKCFIATAACGTDQADDVLRLRLFRERVRPSSAGRRVIDCYETLSPPLARIIARRRWLRFLTRTLVVRPARKLADRLLAK